jgi:fatty acid/phospholipid biosynthesis enzyme
MSPIKVGQPLPVKDSRVGVPGPILNAEQEPAAKDSRKISQRPSESRIVIAKVLPTKNVLQFGTQDAGHLTAISDFHDQVNESLKKTEEEAVAKGMPALDAVRKRDQIVSAMRQGVISPIKQATTAAKLGGYDGVVDHGTGLAMPLSSGGSVTTGIMRLNKNNEWERMPDIRD